MVLGHRIRTGRGLALPTWLERTGRALLFPFVLWGGGLTPRGARILRFPRPVPPPKETLAVATWNIHFGCGSALSDGCACSEAEVRAHLDRIAEAVQEWDLDLVALQEVDRRADRTHRIDQLRYLARRMGFGFAAWTTTWLARWVPHPGLRPSEQIGRVWSGQAILSRYPLHRARRIALPQPQAFTPLINAFYLHRAILSAEVEVGPRRARILDAHLDAFSGENRAQQVDRLLEVLSRSPPHTLLLGDLNAVPPEALHRAGFDDEPWTDMRGDRTIERLRALPGWSEVGGPFRPEWKTFPAGAPNRRLDYIFLGPGFETLEGRIESPQPPPSDHLPVIARLRFGP